MGDVWIERLDAELDAMGGSPTSAEVSDVTNKFEATSGVAVAVRRAMAGGGSLPDDGVPGQALIRASSTPGDVGWSPGLVTQMIGPFPVAFNTPGIGGSEDGALLTLLDPGTVVLQHIVYTTIDWDGGNFTALVIFIGGPDYGAPDDDFNPLGTGYPVANMNPQVNTGYGTGLSQSCYGQVAADAATGALIAQGAGTATQGAADIYAIIASPIT